MSSNDIVVELGLTRGQVESIMWVLVCWLKQYEGSERSTLQQDAQEILEALEGV